jgi:hypothetical protein
MPRQEQGRAHELAALQQTVLTKGGRRAAVEAGEVLEATVVVDVRHAADRGPQRLLLLRVELLDTGTKAAAGRHMGDGTVGRHDRERTLTFK